MRVKLSDRAKEIVSMFLDRKKIGTESQIIEEGLELLLEMELLKESEPIVTSESDAIEEILELELEALEE